MVTIMKYKHGLCLDMIQYDTVFEGNVMQQYHYVTPPPHIPRLWRYTI